MPIFITAVQTVVKMKLMNMQMKLIRWIKVISLLITINPEEFNCFLLLLFFFFFFFFHEILAL